jgi:hypothetical protein
MPRRMVRRLAASSPLQTVSKLDFIPFCDPNGTRTARVVRAEGASPRSSHAGTGHVPLPTADARGGGGGVSLCAAGVEHGTGAEPRDPPRPRAADRGRGPPPEGGPAASA